MASAIKIKKEKAIHFNGSYPSVTLIICAKNESGNLYHNLPELLNLHYPGIMEIILVNDGSTDNTADIIQSYADRYTFVTSIHIGEAAHRDLPGKKFALRTAVAAVTTDFVLLTDADCVPIDSNWVKVMIEGALSGNVDVLLGYGAYEEQQTLINNFIQFETLHTAMQYFSYSGFNRHYMGVGRNLLYRSVYLRQALEDAGLLKIMRRTVSGDDDLIVSYLSGKCKIGICVSPESYTISKAATDWNIYFKQKSRHTSSSKYYNWRIKLSLGLYALSHWGFWISSFIILVLALRMQAAWDAFTCTLLLVFIMLLLLKYSNYYLWRRVVHNRVHPVFLLVLDFFWSIYNVILSPYIFWKNKQKWN